MATSSGLLNYLKEKKLSEKAIGNIMGQYEAEGKHGNVENLNWTAKNLLMYYGPPGYVFTFKGKSYTVPRHRNTVKFKTFDDAQAIASKGEEAVGNALYGNRKDLGNAADEGYKYRGRGAIQITGKNNYKALGEEFFLEGLVDDPNVFVDNPDLVNDAKFADKVPYHYFTGIKKVDPSKLEDPAVVHRAVGPGTGGVGSKEYLKRVEAGNKWASIIANTAALGSWDDTNPQIPFPVTQPSQIAQGFNPATDKPEIAQGFNPATDRPEIAQGLNQPAPQPQYGSMEELLQSKGIVQEPVNINQEPTGLENPFLSVKNWWNSL